MKILTGKRKNVATHNRQRFLLGNKTSFAAYEAYKALRTNVMFSLPGSECKCVGVTSPTPGDGKSTTAANLAISLAQIGKRVLLVDCDMRLPTVSQSFRIPAAPGLSDFLTGQAKVEEAVRRVEAYELNILPAGNIPPDPTGLLEARQLEHLFTAFRKIYDYVIVDLPPVTTVPDAVILARQLDGYILVVREKQTRHSAVSEMLRQLELANAKIIGFATTGGTENHNKYYKYKKP